MTISWDPIIFHIGSTAIGWHGVLMLLGIVAGTLLVFRLGPRYGISRETVINAAFWIVLGGLLGARLTHVADNLDTYSQYPTQILAFWSGGLGWYGGLLGGIVAGTIFAWKNKLNIGRFADLVGLGGILGLAIGRMGCTVNGDAWGTPTNLPWGLTYTHPDAFADLYVAGHPSPVYEILLIAIIFGGLWKLKDRLRPNGALFLIMLASYSFGRFFISWTRAESAVLGPLHQAHIISIVIFIAAIALMVYFKIGLKDPEEPAYDTLTSGDGSVLDGTLTSSNEEERLEAEPKDLDVITGQEQNREC